MELPGDIRLIIAGMAHLQWVHDRNEKVKTPWWIYRCNIECGRFPSRVVELMLDLGLLQTPLYISTEHSSKYHYMRVSSDDFDYNNYPHLEN